MYRYLACLCLFFAVAYAGVMPASYSTSDAYGGNDNSYGTRQERRCTPYFDTVQEDRCEAYTERTCTTTQRESCTDVADQNCRAVVASKQARKCFNVTEQRCALKEDVQFDTIQVPIVVQKCQRVNERVCDTVYDTSSRVQEEQACINLENPECTNVENTLYDRTCRTTTQFDCDTSYVDSYGNAGGSAGGNAGGNAGNAGGYGNDGGNSGDYGTSSTYGGSQNAYGQAQTNCRRSQDTKCYKTPRTVTVTQCGRRSDRVCETLREASPSVSARQVCRNEEKKVCDLEERTQPKQVKKYVYSKQCSASPRTLCENADEKTLVPSCAPVTRKQCSWSPQESCQDTPKEHCFKVSRQVRRERCEMVTVANNAAGNAGSTGSSSFNAGSTGSSSFSTGSSSSGFSGSGSSGSSGSGFADNGQVDY